jgi:hypothetical protein
MNLLNQIQRSMFLHLILLLLLRLDIPRPFIFSFSLLSLVLFLIKILQAKKFNFSKTFIKNLKRFILKDFSGLFLKSFMNLHTNLMDLLQNRFGLIFKQFLILDHFKKFKY